jgi:DNA repair protein RecN (Recombination protein N)
MRRSKIAEGARDARAPHADQTRLARLEIENFGLIARAELDFSGGFTVCTGETGSGKTMLLGALAFVLGERSSADVVRGGAARARVTLAVEPDAALRARLAEDGYEIEPSEPTLLVREMLATGKSLARINGRLVSSGELRAYGDTLLERVGQHEQQRLLSQAYQLDLLDAFAGGEAQLRRAAVRAAHESLRCAEADLEALETGAGRAQAELEFARFALAEIEAAAPVAGEDDTLRERRAYLTNVERIRTALAGAHEALAASENSASDALGTAASLVGPIARYTPELTNLASALAALQSDASDAALALVRALEATELDTDELEAATARLDLLERLKKKYGGTLESVLATSVRYAETARVEATRDDREAELRARVAAGRATLQAEARELSLLRATAAAALGTAVAAELTGLAMPAARFAAELEPLGAIGPSGAERVEFSLAPNPGEPLRALARAASGGELSRVLLALVVVLADRRAAGALAFDEIDAGIGGATASAVGVRLGALARRGQVLCVTHLAQIASWADRHYVLRKREEGGATVVDVIALGDRPAVEEIARMLSGSTAAVALEHAQTLVRDARASKALY